MARESRLLLIGGMIAAAIATISFAALAAPIVSFETVFGSLFENVQLTSVSLIVALGGVSALIAFARPSKASVLAFWHRLVERSPHTIAPRPA